MAEAVTSDVTADGGNLEVTDPRLLLAAQQSEQSRQMLPVIKEELRLRIMTKRHAQGKEDIVIDFNNNSVKYELTDAELEKKRRRREQNRRAAQRCRLKKKRMQKGTIENYEMVLHKHNELTNEVHSLKQEVQQLQAMYAAHIHSGTCCYVTSDTVSDESACVQHVTGDASPASSFTTPHDVSNSLFDAISYTSVTNVVNNTNSDDSYCGELVADDSWKTGELVADDSWKTGERHGADAWMMNGFRQQVVTNTTTLLSDQDISDIFSDGVYLEHKEMVEDPLLDPLNQSFYDVEYLSGKQQLGGSACANHQDSCSKQHMEEYRCGSQQNQVMGSQIGATHSPSHPCPGILDRQDEMYSEGSNIYLVTGDECPGESCVEGLRNQNDFSSCEQSHLGHLTAEP